MDSFAYGKGSLSNQITFKNTSIIPFDNTGPNHNVVLNGPLKNGQLKVLVAGTFTIIHCSNYQFVTKCVNVYPAIYVNNVVQPIYNINSKTSRDGNVVCRETELIVRAQLKPGDIVSGGIVNDLVLCRVNKYYLEVFQIR